jgi:hypothetical protein
MRRSHSASLYVHRAKYHCGDQYRKKIGASVASTHFEISVDRSKTSDFPPVVLGMLCNFGTHETRPSVLDTQVMSQEATALLNISTYRPIAIILIDHSMTCWIVFQPRECATVGRGPP